MPWLAIIAALLPLLKLLLEWLSKSDSLSERQQRKVNEVIGLTNKIRSKAVTLGCKSEGEE